MALFRQAEKRQTYHASPSSVSLTEKGVLRVASPNRPAQISVDKSADGLNVTVTIDGVTERFARSQVQAILISARPGHTWINVDGQIGIPTEVIADY